MPFGIGTTISILIVLFAFNSRLKGMARAKAWNDEYNELERLWHEYMEAAEKESLASLEEKKLSDLLDVYLEQQDSGEPVILAKIGELRILKKVASEEYERLVEERTIKSEQWASKNKAFTSQKRA
ncbi:hypothetical protein ACGRL8_09115 [Vibrio rumoiensis]|uniref:hypothetical protein n=1 Tax=Vibrio rumoiensis TaxID=76258 RepID=UPI003747D5D2